jgi:tetratricopeptide (TPR) repeat protein
MTDLRRSILWILIAVCLLPVPVYGEASPSDPGAETRALVQRLVLDRAAAVASVQRIADEREEQLFAELAAKDRRLRTEQRTRKEAQAELAAVTVERQRLVDEIAARDFQFAAEIGEYRRQVASIAESPDPRKREALKRYAEGDRAGGFEALVAIQKAETKAVAAGWRGIAILAKDRKDRGEMGTAEVISFYETAQNLDADDAQGWIELQQLYQEAGRLPDARRAAEQALAHAQNDSDRAAAEDGLGDVLVASGDRAGARSRFEKSLEIRERLAAANPDRATQREVSVSLNRLGDVLVESGDFAGARARFEASVKIRERLAAARPDSDGAQRDLGVSLDDLGRVLTLLHDRPGARVQFEKSLKITERLAAARPGSTDAQRELSVSLERVGTMLLSAGDRAAGIARLEEALKIRERLAASNPDSARAQRELIVSHITLGLLGSGPHSREGLRIALDLQKKGLLAPTDAWMIDELRRQVAAAEKAEP